jgi:hypothetical protein
MPGSKGRKALDAATAALQAAQHLGLGSWKDIEKLHALHAAQK